MSLSTFLTDLDAARARFRQLLAGKSITVGSGATIIDCLDLLADYWNVAAPVVTPGRFNLYGSDRQDNNIALIVSRVNLDHSYMEKTLFPDGSGSFNTCISGILGVISSTGHPDYSLVFTPYQFDNNSGWSKVSDQYAIRNGKLYFINSGNVFQVGGDSDWIDVYSCSEGALGIRNGGYLYVIENTSILPLDGSGGWKILRPVRSGNGLTAVSPDGKPYDYLFGVSHGNNFFKMSDIAGDWTCATGFGNGTETDTYVTYSYAICDGKLYGGSTNGLTQIGISNQWTLVSGHCSIYKNSSTPDEYAYGLCAGMLYRIGGMNASLIDSGAYTDVAGHYAIRNNRLIDCDTMTEVTDRYVVRISAENFRSYVFWIGAAEYLTLDAPEELYLYSGETANDDPDEHEWTDDDVLTVRVLDGATALPTHCRGFNGVDFETDALSHLCAGYRVLCDVGYPIADGTELTIQWLRGSTVVKTETRTFTLEPEPRYFVRPTGEGNYSLKIGGTAVEAEVYYNDEWIDFPDGVLSSTYAGCPVRTKTAVPQDAIACWSDEGVDGDPFWYLT